MLFNDIYTSFKVEDKNFESKARLSRDDTLSWLKTIAGFSNAEGGILVVGVEDKTNKLLGFDLQELDKEKNYFYNQIKEHFATMPEINSKILEYEIHNKKKYVIVFYIEESIVKPVILKMQGAPLIYIRRDGFTNYATIEEIMQMAKNCSNPKYDLDKTNIKFDFNKFLKLRKFYFDNVKTELTIKNLESINFYTSDGYLYKGANLFSDDYDGKDLKVVFTIYKGLTRGDDYIFSSQEFNGNIIDCYKFIYDNVNLKMNHGFIKKETYRIDLDAFPKRSLFEAIINSLAHKDYYIDGSAIYVDMFKNRLSISSPGCPYEKKELERTYKLDTFASKRRNELISNIFVLCHAMEAKGSGFEKIMADYNTQDAKHKPFIYSKNNQFTIVLPDLTNEDGIDIATDGIRILSPINNVTRFDISILAYCYAQYRSIKEISAYLGLSNSTFLRKDVILNLVNQGFLLEAKEGNKIIYSSNKEKVSLT